MVSKRDKQHPIGRAPAVSLLETTRLSSVLGGLDLNQITGTTSVMRSISSFERLLHPSRHLVGIEPLGQSAALYGLTSERRSTLFSAFAADNTARMVQQHLGHHKLFADQVSRTLAVTTGAHMRADLASLLAGAIGFDQQRLRRTQQMLTGASDAYRRMAEWRPFAQHPLLGDQAGPNLTRWIESLQPTLGAMAESAMRLMEQLEEVDEGAVAFVQRHGWPLPVALPFRVVHRLVRLVDRPKREVTRTMLDSFGPRTRAFRDSRDALMASGPFRDRGRAIDQALRAMRRGDQYAAICTMLPLVEGVLVDVIFAGHEPPAWRAVDKAVAELADADLEDAWATRSVETLLLSATGGVALFDRFDRREYGVPGESRRLNRHAILHGSARRYGTRENSLKLFLLLVALAEVLDDYAETATAAGPSAAAAA